MPAQPAHRRGADATSCSASARADGVLRLGRVHRSSHDARRDAGRRSCPSPTSPTRRAPSDRAAAGSAPSATPSPGCRQPPTPSTSTCARRSTRCRSHGERAALLLVDLDGLKAINDAFGHDDGRPRSSGSATSACGAEPARRRPAGPLRRRRVRHPAARRRRARGRRRSPGAWPRRSRETARLGRPAPVGQHRRLRAQRAARPSLDVRARRGRRRAGRRQGPPDRGSVRRPRSRAARVATGLSARPALDLRAARRRRAGSLVASSAIVAAARDLLADGHRLPPRGITDDRAGLRGARRRRRLLRASTRRRASRSRRPTASAVLAGELPDADARRHARSPRRRRCPSTEAGRRRRLRLRPRHSTPTASCTGRCAAAAHDARPDLSERDLRFLQPARAADRRRPRARRGCVAEREQLRAASSASARWPPPSRPATSTPPSTPSRRSSSSPRVARRSASTTASRRRRRAGRAAARPRQARHPRRDPAQARPARRGRVGRHARPPARRARGSSPPIPELAHLAPTPSAPSTSAGTATATRSAWRGEAIPRRQPHRLRLRRLLTR